MPLKPNLPLLAAIVFPAALGLLVACSSPDPGPIKPTTVTGNEKRDTEIKHEPCDGKADGPPERFIPLVFAEHGGHAMRKGPDGAQVLNDHADPDYDAGVVKRLRAIDDAVQPVCADLADALDRFAHYGPRLAHAIDRLEDGDLDYATKPMIDSYHTVWFELHEDLLATLGIERSKEGVS